MSIFASPRFLRRVLWADAASCLASGAVQLAAPDALPALLGLPPLLLVDTGIFLVAYALLVGWLAARERPPRGWVAFCALGNLGWAVGCVAAIALLHPGALGTGWIAAQAACVLVLADLQWLALRATRRHGGVATA